MHIISPKSSVIEIGYDGKLIDVSVSGLTGGFTYLLKEKQFKFGWYGGWFGWSISIDFVELLKLIFGGE